MQGLPAGTQMMRVPAPLLRYWMGATELPGAAGDVRHTLRNIEAHGARRSQPKHPTGSTLSDEQSNKKRGGLIVSHP